MKRAIISAGILSLAGLFISCTSGGSGGGGDGEITIGPLTIKYVVASPSSGTGSTITPLRITFTAIIDGGKAPYFYAWDFENDGAFDFFSNSDFNTTINAKHDYFLKPADAGGGSTVYQAVLRVKDSEETVVISDPINVFVESTQILVIDPNVTRVFSDEQAADGSYIFRTGEPVYFRAGVFGSQGSLQYLWDFDGDGVVDSQVINPQYTYTYNEAGVRVFLARLTIIDANGNELKYDFIIPVNGPFSDAPPPPSFEIILNTEPPAVAGIIRVDFDPTGSDPALPLEPELEMAVVVNPDPQKGGVPPYEYYWDYENDGAMDSQEPSPTIPFYDPVRKILVNPYKHLLDSKTYTLRVLVIDSSGQVQEEYRTVVVTRKTVVGELVVVPTYGVAGSGLPYAEVVFNTSDPSVRFEPTEVNFAFAITGSTGIYEWQMDADGDGSPDYPLIDDDDDPGTPDVPGWGVVTGNSVSTTVIFGPFDDDGNVETPPIRRHPAVGYFGARATIRSLDPLIGGEEDRVTLHVPVSLVRRNTIAPAVVDGTLQKRADHTMAAIWNTANVGGANGRSLDFREVIITGGAQGETPLLAVERLNETFVAPTEAGQFEARSGLAATTRVGMNVGRRGAFTWTEFNVADPPAAPNFYSIGGRNLLSGALASAESIPLDDIGGTLGWAIRNEINAPGHLPLFDMAGMPITFTPEPGVNLPAAFIFGGITDSGPGTTGVVSHKTILYLPPTTPDPYVKDAYIDILTPVPTPRYDACAAVVAGAVYLIGGRVAGGQSVATVEVFNLSSNFWEVGPSLQDARAGAVCQVVGGSIYVLGGGFFPSDESNFTLVTTAEVLNPVTGVWSYTLPPTQATVDAASVLMPGPGAVYTDDEAVPTDHVDLNTMWYFGGAGVAGETDFLEEFVYFYSVPEPEPIP